MLHAEIIYVLLATLLCIIIILQPSSVRRALQQNVSLSPSTFAWVILFWASQLPVTPPTIAIRLKFAQPQRRVKMYYLLL